MRYDPNQLPDQVLAFLEERHLASLTTLRADSSPHVVPVGFSWDDSQRTVRIITFEPSTKVSNVLRGNTRAAVSQVDGGRWLTLEGVARVTRDPAEVKLALDGYARRYREPSTRSDRVAIEISVDRVMGRA
jgi:hypothetical protein